MVPRRPLPRTFGLRFATGACGLALACSLIACKKPIEKASAVALTADSTFVLEGTTLYGAGPTLTVPNVLFGVKWLTMGAPGTHAVAQNVRAISGYGAIQLLLGMDGHVSKMRMAPKAPDHPELELKVTPIDAFTDATAITADEQRGCARTGKGEIHCFALGDGEELNLRMVRSDPSLPIVEIALFGHAVLARTAEGALHLLWDAPRTIADQGVVPPPVMLAKSGVLSVRRDPAAIVITRTEGVVERARFNGEDLIIDEVPALHGATFATLTNEVQCGIFEHSGKKEARCAGTNDTGQLGDGKTLSRAELQPVLDLENPVQVIASPTIQLQGRAAAHTCALLADGAVRCWGNGTASELGREEESSLLPIPFTHL